MGESDKLSERELLEAAAKAAPHPLDALLPEICQLLDAVKTEWTRQGCWSEWDESVRARIAAYNISKLTRAAAALTAQSNSHLPVSGGEHGSAPGAGTKR